jgi:hypothetical protein
MAFARPAASWIAAAALLTAGCGSTTLFSANRAHRTTKASVGPLPDAGSGPIPAPAPTGTPASPASIRVIEGWSEALRRGDVRAAAAYFQHPSEMINGVGPGGAAALIRIRDAAQAEAANQTLPCGAKFISADQRGRYVNALFQLTGRPGPGGSTCGTGVGQTARTNFLIENGRIAEWIRAPDDPGDNGSPTAPRGSGGGARVV